MLGNKDEILVKLTEILVEMFEVEEKNIREDALLSDDLDIDSIDAIDLIVRLKELTGKKISPEEFKSVRTVGDVVKAIQKVMANQ
ncbi:acyl carrier protein [Microbulbifer spongiae]|uniref:Acyl carrier protein n=1 Tax=Microbulbifer spongiae TaxID=2944933 RepID=A0ABY9EC48_9GAMM|nr:acyl carrier protein [Microbulbifer sp. MI-G]WKD49931.1 acyl carrier protein [Microbulbifer sp. MI-G]